MEASLTKNIAHLSKYCKYFKDRSRSNVYEKVPGGKGREFKNQMSEREVTVLRHLADHIFTHLAAARAERLDIAPKRRR